MMWLVLEIRLGIHIPGSKFSLRVGPKAGSRNHRSIVRAPGKAWQNQFNP